MKIIDIHCHMFNLKYLPVAGILRRYSNNKIPHLVAVGLEWLLIKKTRSEYDKKSFVEAKSMLPSEFDIPAYKYLGLSDFNYTIKEALSFKTSEVTEAILRMPTVSDLLASPLAIALDDYIKDEKGSVKFLEVNKTLNINADSIKEKVQQLFNWLKRLLNKIADLYDQLRNYLKWFVFMTNSEEEIYQYITTKDSQNTELFLHLMMDVDYFLNKNENIDELTYNSYFDFESEQIPNMQDLNNKHKSNLIGFVAFNPARKNHLTIIQDAVLNRGFKGVKIYPPLGYRAFGDLNYSNQIEDLVRFCVTSNVPLFTHCNNQGFEAWPGEGHSGYNSNPKYWKQLLDVEENKRLILCLGHAGGVEGWFSTNKETDLIKAKDISEDLVVDESAVQEKDWNKSYAALVFKLCVEKENVYCDASYLDEMINSDGTFDEKKKSNFKKRLLKLFKSEPKFAKKIMYGSDWHMLFQEGKNGVYLKNYLEFFKDAEFDPYRDDFFYNNANRYLTAESNEK